MASKRCSKCGIEKDSSEFHKAKRAKGGLQSWCKECRHSHDQSVEVKEKRAEYDRKYRREHLDKMSSKTAQWYRDNVEHVCEYNKEYRRERKAALAKKRKQWEKAEKERSGCVIYLIEIGPKLYLGSSSWFRNRVNQHKGGLRRGNHRNRHLQAAYDTYGPDVITTSVLYRFDSIEEARALEKKMIEGNYDILLNVHVV